MLTGLNPFENRKIDENVMFILFSIFVLSLPFSKALISIISVSLLVFSFFFSVRRKTLWGLMRSDYTWIGMSVIYITYLGGFLFTKNTNAGLNELNRVLNWILISFAIFIAPRLSQKKYSLILLLFICGVTLSTFLSFYKMILAPVFGVQNFREVNFISHIPFSLQISFSIFILLYFTKIKNQTFDILHPILKIIWILWLLFFVIVLKSLLGLISFYFTSIILIIYAFNYGIVKSRKKLFLIGVIIMYFFPIVYLGNVIWNYYNIKDPSEEKVEKYTSLGNEYNFNFDIKFKENGHYVYWYVCEKELKEVWAKRSQYEFYGLNDKGYRVAETLIRYMTSKGLRKDADGFQQLKEKDIRNIEKGIPNYIYDSPAYSIYPRVYETIWEIDHYLLTGDPNDQSLSQRFEFSKAAFNIIKENFWFGIGTGNYEETYRKTYMEIGSKLRSENYGVAHNQYVSYSIKFGIIGLFLIMTVLIYLIYKKQLFKSVLFVLFIVCNLIANFGDTMWETHVGLAFFVFFFSLFLWHYKHEWYVLDK